MFTKINDDVFNKSEVCLTISQNSVSYRNFGCTGDIVQKYAYADVAGLREADPNLKSFAKLKCRDPEGSAKLKTAAIATDGPTVGTIITQYGIGRPIEENNISRKIVQYCTDTTITSHLAADTQENRIILFNKAVFRLGELLSLSYYDHIKTIIFPVGIGRSGRVDNIWLLKYLPIIYSFSNDMQKCGKRIILLMPHYSELDRVFKHGKDYASHCYKKLRSLHVLTNSEFLCDIPVPSYNPDNNDIIDDDDDDD